ncbi:HAD family hydrolase [Roseibium sp.]|uniref:HAD family hydrolase n=1 Tax=Roseibium sp. TaxID=1936156 RepID=UPI003A976D56
MSLSAALFDLDGTLTDPFEGITRSIQYALEKMQVHVPAAEELRWCIGPPLWESFEKLLGTTDRSVQDQAVAFYRERYRKTGLFENVLIEGIDTVVRDLHGAGVKLYVATSKPHAYAGTIVEHFGLLPFFNHVHGSELDGTRSAKTELIAYILEQEGLSAESCVMIGDRKHDLIGANANHVEALGVMWGYGSRAELAAENPAGIFDRPADLGSYLRTWGD